MSEPETPELEEQPKPEFDDGLPHAEPEAAAEPEKPTLAHWPHVPAVRGEAYGFKCPTTGAYMVAMAVETWQDFSNRQQELRDDKEHLLKNNQELRDYARRARTGVSVSEGGIVTHGGKLPSQDPRQR